MSKQKIATGPAALAFLAVTVLTLGLWAAVGGPVVTDGTSGTALPEKLGKNPAPGRTLRMPTGTDQRGAYWVDTETMPAGTTPGQVIQAAANTVTATVQTTGTQTTVGTGTYTYSVSVSGTVTRTETTTGATGTYTHTATGATNTHTWTATSTSTSITTSGSVSSGHSKSRLAAADGYLFSLGSGFLDVYSLSNPDSPSLLTSVQLYDSTGSALCISESGPSGKTLYAGSGSRIEAFTVGASPQLLGYGTAAGSRGYGCAAAGDRLYLTRYHDDVIEVMSIATRSTPSQIKTVSADNPYGISASGSNLYVSDGDSTTLTTWSLSDPNTPSSGGTDNAASQTLGISVFGPRAFSVSYYSSAMDVWDISTPSNPSKLETVSASGFGTIAVWGSRAYLSNGDPQIVVYNLDKYGLQAGTQTTTNTQTVTGTQTTTNTQTVTGTVTASTSTSATATQTVSATMTYSAQATTTAYGTNTSWTVAGGNLYDPAGTFFLSSMPSEGGNFPGYLRWGEIPTGYETPTSYSAICQAGSDGLIATVWPMSGTNLIARKRMIAGWWKSQLLARVNTNGAAIRVEVWSRDGAYDDTGVKLFDWTTQVFTNTTARAVVTEAARLVDDSLASNDRLRVFFKLYATCSAATTVTIDLGDSAFSSRIYSPFLGDKIDSAEVAYGGAGIGETAKAALDNYANARRTARRFMVPISQFPVVNGATVTTLGAIPDRLSAYLMHDGQTDDAGGALITLPMDMVGTSVSVVPVWAPETTASSSLAKIRWSSVHKVLQHYSLQSPVDAIAAGTTTTWSGRYCYSDCVTNYIQEDDGYQLDGLFPGDTIMLDIRRLGADAADTLPAGAYLIGVQIQYASSL